MKNVWKTIAGNEVEKENYKKEIEEKLIDSKQETRKYVYEKDLSSISGILETLLQKGLIRRDQRGDDHYIELSHDRLIRPLIESARQRIAEENLRKEYEEGLRKVKEEKEKAEAKRKKTRSWIYAGALIAVVAIIAALYLQTRRKKELEMQQAYFLINGADPTLAYNIAQIGGKENFSYFKNLLKDDTNKKLGYITTAFIVSGNILNVYISTAKKQIIVVTASEIRYFNNRGLIDSIKPFDDEIIYSTYQNRKGYLAVRKRDSYSDFELKSFDGVTRFKFSYDGIPTSLALSKDAKYLLIDNSFIFDTGQNNDKYRQVRPFNVTAISFTNNDSLVKGLLDGQVLYAGRSYNTNSAIVSVNTINDSVIIARSKDNSITFIDSRQTEVNSLRGNTMKSLRAVGGETLGSINAIGVSDAGGKVIFGGDDRRASLYSTNGTKLATLNGHTGKVISANFSEDGEEIVTASSSGEVFVWKVGNPDVLYQNGQMRKLSALDYRIFNLPNNDPADSRDNLSNKLQNLVNDNVSFIRQFYSDNEGEEYDSSNTFMLMDEFETIIHPPYVSRLSMSQKRLLLDNYARIVSIQLERTDTTNIALFNTLLDKRDSLGVSSILLDTLDFQKALQFNDLFDYYIAGLVEKDYEQVMKYSNKKKLICCTAFI